MVCPFEMGKVNPGFENMSLSYSWDGVNVQAAGFCWVFDRRSSLFLRFLHDTAIPCNQVCNAQIYFARLSYPTVTGLQNLLLHLGTAFS